MATRTREIYGSERETTNNRMELKAAVEGLRALKEPCEVEIVTDSNYLKNGITEWIHKWKMNGWRTGDKKPVANQDLWHELDEQNARHKTTWSWTKGHASHADNNRCDELATAARGTVEQPLNLHAAEQPPDGAHRRYRRSIGQADRVAARVSKDARLFPS